MGVKSGPKVFVRYRENSLYGNSFYGASTVPVLCQVKKKPVKKIKKANVAKNRGEMIQNRGQRVFFLPRFGLD